MEQGVGSRADGSGKIHLAGAALMHVRQLAGGFDQVTGEGHSPVLRAEDPLVVVEVVAEMRKATFAN